MINPFRQNQFIYFLRLRDGYGPIKIGCSENAANRLVTLMSWSPFPLEIVVKIHGNREIERRLHGIFADSHSHGEWFYPSSNLIALIDNLISGKSLEELIDFNAKILPFRRRQKRNFTPEYRLYLSYSSRLRHRFRQFWRKDGTSKYEPYDVHQIMDRWRGFRGRNELPIPIKPTNAEIARLEQVLANPSAYAVPSEQSYRRVAE